MGLSIKNPNTEQRVRQLVELTGETVTGAITVAVEERIERLLQRGQAADAQAEVAALVRQIAALPDLDRRSADEILGYDDDGLPS
jgi:antitoxin VapB